MATTNFVERNAVLEELSNPNVKKEAMELAECSQSFHGRQGEKKETQKNRFFQTIFADFYREKTGILATDLIFQKKEIPITYFELEKKWMEVEKNFGKFFILHLLRLDFFLFF